MNEHMSEHMSDQFAEEKQPDDSLHCVLKRIDVLKPVCHHRIAQSLEVGLSALLMLAVSWAGGSTGGGGGGGGSGMLQGLGEKEEVEAQCH